MAALGDGRWKLVWHEADGRFELYDLASDPGEQRDLAALQPERVEQLHAELLALRRAALADAPLVADERASGAGLGAAERRALADLGYVEAPEVPSDTGGSEEERP